MALEIGHRRVFEVAAEIDEHVAHGGHDAGAVGAERAEPEASHRRTLRQAPGRRVKVRRAPDGAEPVRAGHGADNTLCGG